MGQQLRKEVKKPERVPSASNNMQGGKKRVSEIERERDTRLMNPMQKWAADCWESVELVIIIIKQSFRHPARIISRPVPALANVRPSRSAHFISNSPNSSHTSWKPLF